MNSKMQISVHLDPFLQSGFRARCQVVAIPVNPSWYAGGGHHLCLICEGQFYNIVPTFGAFVYISSHLYGLPLRDLSGSIKREKERHKQSGGYAGKQPGSYLLIQVGTGNDTRRNSNIPRKTLVALGVLMSYEGMGVANVTCEPQRTEPETCSCMEWQIDMHKEHHTSQVCKCMQCIASAGQAFSLASLRVGRVVWLG